MSEAAPFVPPIIDFDPRLADELARIEPELTPVLAGPSTEFDAYCSYSRALTANGGVRITYRDRLRHWSLVPARILAWCGLMSLAYTLSQMFDLPFAPSLLGLTIFAGVAAAFASTGFHQFHTVAIHPDGMIVDGRFFSVEYIGENWPTLQFKKDGDPSRFMLCGIYHTRFIVYASVNRVDGNDRTPELLAQDLDLAMEQLWGRREAIFAATY